MIGRVFIMFKKIKKIFNNLVIVFWVGMIFFSILIFLGEMFSGIFKENENIKLADGFTIDSYNVVLDVKEDNKVYVQENLVVNWEENYHHGIFRYIPEWLEYKGKDGKVIKRKSNVLNLVANNESYSTDRVNKKARIKIGDPNQYVSLGLKQYDISYLYDMGSDPYKGFDEFIFHTYGDYWGTEIKNASIEVHMPKSIEGKKINFYIDKYRKNNVTKYVDYTVNDNILYAKFNQEKYLDAQIKDYCLKEINIINGVCDFNYDSTNNKKLDKALTVDIELPDNYFVKGSFNYGFFSFSIIIIIFLITIYTIYNFKRFGKDFPKRVKTVEFYPPNNLNPAEVGYIYKKQSKERLSIALIIQLASKGYIKIDEIDKDIQITNLIIKPEKLKSFEESLPKRVIEVRKLKESDELLDKKATTMMIHLFKKSDTKKVVANMNKFLEVADTLVNGGYIEIISDNNQDRYSDLESKREKYKQKEKQYEVDSIKYEEALSKVKPLSTLEKVIYDRLFVDKNVVKISSHKSLYIAFNDVWNMLEDEMKDLIFDKKATFKMIISIIITILVLILNIISYFVVEDMDPSWSILYFMGFICIFINVFFTIFMKRRTEYGEEMVARVEGFRDFLVKVEKEKLEMLVMENPSYFYDILPYTYVLNISKVWISKFENIPMQSMDMGSFNYSSDKSFYSMASSVYYPSITPSAGGGSSSSCSSCGGGCSSCGGGCSSCGGGGSW